MRIRRSIKQKAAFTLAELVIAVALLAITIGGVMNGFGYGLNAVRLARENQRATQIMLETAEVIRLYSWDQVNTPGFIPTLTNSLYDPQSPQHPGINYTVKCNISSYPAGGGSPGYSSKIKQLIVTCTWTNIVPHTRTLATLVAQDGEQNYVY